MTWVTLATNLLAAWTLSMGGPIVAEVDLTPEGCSGSPSHSGLTSAAVRMIAPSSPVSVVPLAYCSGNWLPIGYADALDQAAKVGPIVSIVTGTYAQTCPPDWQEAIDRHPDTLFISGAGDLPDTQFQPAGCRHVISVGRSDESGEIYPSGPYHLLAPGNNVPLLGGTYSGTSFSAPIAAGCAAILKSIAPNATALQLRVLLIQKYQSHLNCGAAAAEAKMVADSSELLIVKE